MNSLSGTDEGYSDDADENDDIIDGDEKNDEDGIPIQDRLEDIRTLGLYSNSFQFNVFFKLH
jgi:hypothetical protein